MTNIVWELVKSQEPLINPNINISTLFKLVIYEYFNKYSSYIFHAFFTLIITSNILGMFWT